MDHYTHDAFTWLEGPTKKQYITVKDGTTICFGAGLCEGIPKTIAFGAHRDGRTFAIRAGNANGFRVQKSGSVKAKEFIEVLTAGGVHLPAKYTVQQVEDLWIAELEPQPPIALKSTKKQHKKANFAPLIKEVDHTLQKMQKI